MTDIPLPDTLQTESEQHFFAGARLMEQGDAAGSETAFRRALQLSPDCAEAHANLGLLLERANRLDEAEVHQRQAIEIDPRHSLLMQNFGALLIRRKIFKEAESVCRQALLLSPQSAAAWTNLGVLQTCLSRETEAEQCHRTAMALDPENRTAPYNLAYLLLRQGRFDEGWQLLEARKLYAPLEKHMQWPRWRGEPLQGKSLLIVFEMGHGDMIQFCRYARLTKDQGAARVSVICHDGLKTLFTRLDGIDEVIAASESLPASGWDYWTPPMSFPYLFKTRLDTIPARIPYLSAEPAKIRAWSEIIGQAADILSVGIVWRGNPKFENDADRSIDDPGLLAPLAGVANIRYFSLQKGPDAEAEKVLSKHLPCTEIGGLLDDFSDTAAAIENLDLVITVDTAVAHLAGALGKNCWVLLPAFKTDWRWLTQREDSPWYPQGMRLFRQEKAGDWTAVIRRVTTELEQFRASTHVHSAVN